MLLRKDKGIKWNEDMIVEEVGEIEYIGRVGIEEKRREKREESKERKRRK